jgi:ADP-heptose:LPS heptosyltransferase
MTLLELGSQMTDFADAAAIVENLDLVICVDTAMAHLTAALGKPCWLLLPNYMTDWRWRSEGSASMWYPGVMRLFRQAEMGDWAPVIDELVMALQDWVCEKLAVTDVTAPTLSAMRKRV